MPVIEYAEQIYAGVLGKIIGVYMGRPVEGWSYARIKKELGVIREYVNDRLGVPLIVTDDDISGTFVFFRAIAEHDFSPTISSAEIGDTWLNQIIEDKTILWWGGPGRSTEHTAWYRLKSGVKAPMSGSMELNGPVLPLQIGAQIFIDSWAMANPGDPDRAAAMAREAARVSHDGLAVEAAAFLAAMEAQAFAEPRVPSLIRQCLTYVRDKTLLKLIDDVQSWCSRFDDWEAVREKIDGIYGYDHWAGPCPIISNHAIVLLALLKGGDSFQKALSIAVTSGWDTDCNAGNVGCLNGIRLGLNAIGHEYDFRSPVGDRLYAIGAEGGEAVSDAVRETRNTVRAAAAIRGERVDLPAEKFAFEYPDSTQGFCPCPYSRAVNVAFLKPHASPGLLVGFKDLDKGSCAAVSVPLFISKPEATNSFTIALSPALYPTQTVTGEIEYAGEKELTVRFYLLYHNYSDELERWEGLPFALRQWKHPFEWKAPDLGGQPIYRLGLEIGCAEGPIDGEIRLCSLHWEGAPEKLEIKGSLMSSIWNLHPLWSQAWISSARYFAPDFTHTFCISHTGENGTVVTGGRDWQDYRFDTTLFFSLHTRAGLLIRSQGQRRYYAAVVDDSGGLFLIKRKDGSEVVLASCGFPLRYEVPSSWSFMARGKRISLDVDGHELLAAEDDEFAQGGAGYVVTNGTFVAEGYRVARV